MRTQEQRDEQTLVISSMVIGPAMFWAAPLLFTVILLLFATDLAGLPYLALFAAYFVVVAPVRPRLNVAEVDAATVTA